MSAAPPRALEPVLLGAIGIWALYQAFGNLGAANLNADEPVYIPAGWAYVHGDFGSNPEHPPTAKLIIGLAQLALGPGVVPARVAVGIAVIAGGVLLYLWLRAEIGWAGALCGAGAWLLLPHGVTSGVRIDRFALLDPFMAVFALAAFAAAWRWYRTGSWLWLTLSALAMALSVTSKVPSAAMVPALVLLPVLRALPALRRPRVRPTLRRERMRRARAVRAAAAAIAVFTTVMLAVVTLVYLPAGFVDSFLTMLRFQTAHNTAGHLVAFAGLATTHPPWWANLVFAVDGMGVAAVVALAIGAVAAFAGSRAALALPVLLGGAVLLEWVFQFAVSSVALPHYYYAWVWPLCALFGLGMANLVRLARAQRRAARAGARVLVVASVALALGAAAFTSKAIAAERPRDMALVLPELKRLGVPTGAVLVGGMADWEYLPYLDGRGVTAADSPGVVAIALKHELRFPVDPAVTALLHAAGGHYRRIRLDDVTLYLDERAVLSPATGS